MTSSFREAVIGVVTGLRPGEVVSYGEVAAQAGRPGAGRAVGRILAEVESPIPWWRVVGHDGRLRSPSVHRQAERLANEGVIVSGGRVRSVSPR
ncbi:MAG TPA: MGMT family protein [Acidimicrobiia bacterium]|nr:MGMT family protein [Acidimicrobiia bacterium]